MHIHWPQHKSLQETKALGSISARHQHRYIIKACWTEGLLSALAPRHSLPEISATVMVHSAQISCYAHLQQSSALVVTGTSTELPLARYRVTRSVWSALTPTPQEVQLEACDAGSQSALKWPAGQGKVAPLAV